MADSLREKILLACKTNLEQITEDNGYSQTLTSVQRLHYVLPSYPSTPVVYLYEGTERKSDNVVAGKLFCRMEVFSVYLVQDNTDQTAATCNAMLTDITKAMGSELSIADANSESQTVYLAEQNTAAHTNVESSGLIYCGIEFEATYFHLVGDQTLA